MRQDDYSSHVLSIDFTLGAPEAVREEVGRGVGHTVLTWTDAIRRRLGPAPTRIRSFQAPDGAAWPAWPATGFAHVSISPAVPVAW